MEDSTFFEDAVSEEIIKKWENENKILIPSSYKEWLKFTGYCQIDQNLAELYPPTMFEILKVNDKCYIQIGRLIGDGEILCFCRENSMFFRILDGRISKPVADFKEILKEINRMLGNDSGISNETIQKLFRMLEENRQ